jgi:long-chain fatty acid transport protein
MVAVMKWFILKVSLLVCLVCSFIPQAFGSGFGIFTQGASALGQADAVVAHPDGPSAVFFNPAMMNSLPGTQVEIGTTFIFPNRNYTAPDGSTASTRNTVFTPGTFYLTHAFNDKLSAGLGVFNPFGLGTDWGSFWQGRFIATNSELTTWNINPVASYRILPGLSVAAGVDIVLLDATLENHAPPNQLIPVESGQKFTGSGLGVGYNFGVYYEVNNELSLGASYRSEVEIDLDGDFTSNVLPRTVGGKSTIKLPQQVFAGVAYRPVKPLTIEAAMRWEDWSSFNALQIQFEKNPFGLTSVTYPRNWHSTFAVSLGGKYRLNDMFSLMTGYLYGWNPVPDITFEPAIPDSDTHLFCLGGEARIDKVTIALAYAYQLQYDRGKATNFYGPVAKGTYSSDIHLAGISLGYRF